MSKRYQVLARRYRPQRFQEVIGQTAAVTTLKNAIKFDQIAHAYLFCGSRGIGKTTLARLFAKALNCSERTSDLEPCNQCPSCLEIISGQSLDVLEIDGASNRGIDDIRQINETVSYAPSHGKYKIYIIDEVHMLTKEAFNALLKTLEEPPEQAKFFFATTEPHKVLPTILSRCQRFDLARLQPSLILSKLKKISQDLEREVEEEAFSLIANFSEGSLRDAESLFDQILCFSEAKVTASIVRQALGLVPEELFQSLDQAFSSAHLPYAFELVDLLFQTGKDLSHFYQQLIEHYRNLVNAHCRSSSDLPSLKLYTQSQALYILDLLIQAEPNFQKSCCQRISLESILLQIIRSKNRIPIEILIRHLTEHKASSFSSFAKPLEDVPVASSSKEENSTGQISSPLPPSSLQKPQNALETSSLPKEVSPPQDLSGQSLAIPQKPEPSFEILPPPIEPPSIKSKEILPSDQELQVAHPSPADSSSASKRKDPAQIELPPKKETFSEQTSSPPSLAQKPQSHYDTLLRFAAVELEGTIKN